MSGWKKKYKNGEAVTIVAYGDSWTYGSCADGWKEAREAGYDRELIYGSWVSRLRCELKRQNTHAVLHNQGQGGWKSTQGLEAFQGLVGDLKPDLLILNFGINDWRLGVQLDTYQRAMEEMVLHARNLYCDILLWTSGPISAAGGETYEFHEPYYSSSVHPFEDYNDIIRQLASRHEFMLADVERSILNEWRDGTDLSSWFVDGIHFNQNGHDRILAGIHKMLCPN